MCKIIAEFSTNHMGNMDAIYAGINELDKTGVDYIKFQAYKADKLRKDYPNYDEEYAYYKKCELTDEMITNIIKHCEDKNIKPLFTAFDIETCHELTDKYNQQIIKIASPDCNSWGLLDVALNKYKTVLVSTGMSAGNEIYKLLNYSKALQLVSGLNKVSISKQKKGNIFVMHCVSKYPTPSNQANLKRINELKLLSPNIGYSDHTTGINACIAAISMGCKYIEKHYTYGASRNSKDRCISTVYNGFKLLTRFRDMFQEFTSTDNLMSTKEILDARQKYIGRWGDNS